MNADERYPPKAKTSQHADCIVIGAGMSGLMAARTLSSHGLDVLVLDKGRTVGGRMATRRLESHRFDHGAQSVFLSETGLTGMVTRWLQDGVVQPCQAPTGTPGTPSLPHPVCGIGGINAVAKSLATNLNVRSNCRVIRLKWSQSSWQFATAAGPSFTADSVIMSAPLPQSLALLRLSDIDLPPDIVPRLAAVSYERCLAVMAIYTAFHPLLPSWFTSLDTEPITLIIDNYAKGVSPTAGAITFHTTARFSETSWNAPDEEVTRTVVRAARAWHPQKPVHTVVHRWRYSRASTSHPASHELVETPGLLALAGDGFAGKDIEGAALSGIDAARAILARVR